jgi:hypothetical protein
MQLEFLTGQYCKNQDYGTFLNLVYHSANHTLKVPALNSFTRLESSMRTKKFETSYKLGQSLSFKYYKFFSYAEPEFRLSFYGANLGAVSCLDKRTSSPDKENLQTYNKYSIFYNVADHRRSSTMQEDFAKLYRRLKCAGHLLNVQSALERLKLATG